MKKIEKLLKMYLKFYLLKLFYCSAKDNTPIKYKHIVLELVFK